MVVSVAFLVEVVLVSRVQQHASQERAFDEFREALALGVAPIGPVDTDGAALAVGTPVAVIRIPELGLEQVVVEGTTPAALYTGPGHRRDTPLPGQEGTSVVMGRRAMFGGPFGSIGRLAAGDEVIVTTGQGEFRFEVSTIRRDGDPVSAPTGSARLTLVTADGRPFLPAGAIRVDAELVGEPVGGAARSYSPASLPIAERVMGTDPSTIWALVLWLQCLVLLAVSAVWSWHRWGRAQSWIVFVPPLLLVGLATTGEAMRLFPNVM